MSFVIKRFRKFWKRFRALNERECVGDALGGRLIRSAPASIMSRLPRFQDLELNGLVELISFSSRFYNIVAIACVQFHSTGTSRSIGQGAAGTRWENHNSIFRWSSRLQQIHFFSAGITFHNIHHNHTTIKNNKYGMPSRKGLLKWEEQN